MTEWTPNSQFEEEISRSFQIPPLRSEFVEQLGQKLEKQAQQRTKPARLILGLRPAWVVSLSILILLILSFFAIGPQRVYAEVTRLLGFIPGVGIVDPNSPIRVLADPVSITKDGVTVTVSSATLTTEKTYISYGATGVPSSAYPQKENGKGGCMEPAYFILPDGTRIIAANEMGPLPENVNQVTLVIPCIFNTLPGTVPTDWELPLQFIPTPPDMTLLPVIEIQPTLSSSPMESTSAATVNPLSIIKVLEIGDQYVIEGEFRYGALGALAHDNIMDDGSIWVITNIHIRDASGQEYQNLPADDIPLPTPTTPNAETWDFKIDKGFAPPLTITYGVEHISPVGSPEQGKFDFNVGQNPQDGDEWTLDQSFVFGGYQIHLVSLTYSSNFGYEFHFVADPGANYHWISVGIDGYTANCGGGGGGDNFSAEFTSTFCITQEGSKIFPTGLLTGTVTFQAVKRENSSFEIHWSPNLQS
jgi:hypothetical protein